MKLNKIFIIFLTLVITLIITSGCSINNDQYKKVTVTKNGIRFSFEYPSSYHDLNHTLDSPILTGSLLLVRKVKYSSENPDTKLMMSITTGSSYSKAENEINNIIKELQQSDPSNHINILENKEIYVAGVKGFYLYFYAEYGQVPRYLTHVYFDWKDRTFKVNMDALEPVADKAKNEFDHIITSIKFLD